MTLFVALDTTPVPSLVVAVTVNVYAWLGLSPVTVALVATLLPVAVSPPGLDVTVYPRIVPVPADPGAVQVTVAVNVSATALAVPIVGASGFTLGAIVRLA